MNNSEREKVCLDINKWYKLWYDTASIKESKTLEKVKIPIYKSWLKKVILKFLTLLFFKKAYLFSPKGKRVSDIDFTRWVKPDDWKEYEIRKSTMLAMPELLEEHTYCWETNIVHEFFKEDLQYGFCPIDLDVAEIGGGPTLFDKENRNIYQLGSGIWVKYDYISDFSLFKEGKVCKLDWENPPYVKRLQKPPN